VASTAFPEMGTYRLNAPNSRLQELHCFRSDKRLLFFDRPHAQPVSGNGEWDKNYLALVFAQSHASINELFDCEVK
jgi:hypothetical protein